MDYQKLILVGNATVDAEQKTSKKGDVAYTTFSVGVSEAKDKTTFFPITVFGKHGEAVAKYITKGRQVLVDGRITVGDNNRFNVVADRVRFGPEPYINIRTKPNKKKAK
jgi:single-strand DNA-binding protein